MADIAKLTSPQHVLLKSEQKQAVFAKRRAAIDAARAALPAARSRLEEAKSIEKKAKSLYYETDNYGNGRNHNNALRNRNYAEDNVDRLKRIADGKATDNMLAIKISPRNRNTRSFQKRQNNRKAAAQSERPKGWLWGGTRRMRKMTRRR